MSIIEKALEKMKKGDKESPLESSVTPAQSGQISGKESSATSSGAASVLHTKEHIPEAETLKEDALIPSTKSVNIDLERLTALGMVVPQSERSQISEEYRLIKRPLIQNADNKGATVVAHPNLIMVTSSLPGEGKTFSSINLAMSIAVEKDKTVLLVDADVARPSLVKVLGIDSEKGLIDYLLGEVSSLSEVLHRTNIPNLSIISAGKRHTDSTELLASDNMKYLLEELARRYPDRIIIFDSPPLLATSEASVLANQMGQIVAVVEAGSTSQEVLKEALDLINPEMIIGLILNKSSQKFGTDYYGPYHSTD